MWTCSFEQLLLTIAPYGTLLRAARFLAIKDLAAKWNLDVSDAELQAAANRFRVDNGLLNAEKTVDWLSGRGLTSDAWENEIRTTLQKYKLLESKRASREADQRFRQSSKEFLKINVGQLAVEDEGIAHEIYLLLIEGQYSFDVLARRYSILFAPGTAPHPLSRRTLFQHEAPASLVDAACAPALRAPVTCEPIEHGGLWYIYRIYTIEPPVFDEETRRHIRSLVVDQHLHPVMQKHLTSLLDRLGCHVPNNLEKLCVASLEEDVQILHRQGLFRNFDSILTIERPNDMQE